MPVPRLEEYQLQFDQIYDGAYRYLDRCGEFMAKVQQAAGFTPSFGYTEQLHDGSS